MAKGKFFVFSTLAADVVYRSFAKTDGDVPVVDQGVLIKGGAGVANRKTGETPAGHMTEVTPEQYELLQKDPVFKMHEQNGHIRVEQTAGDPEAVASEMNNRDQSAQLQEGDFEEKAEDPKETGKLPTPGDVKPRGKA